MDDRNKMLIDATHPEETRVVVLRGGRVEEFDYESAARKLLRGNIYLAKVTRVEPSLQAAFVEYGGNRHGFLAFGEIHPDYYQIPFADKQALLQEEAEADAEAEAQAEARAEARSARDHRSVYNDETVPADMPPQRPDTETGSPESSADGRQADADASAMTVDEARAPVSDGTAPDAVAALPARAEQDREEVLYAPRSDTAEPGPDLPARAAEGSDTSGEPAPDAGEEGGGYVVEVAEPVEAPETVSSGDVEQVGDEDALEEVPERPRRRMRSYKIQEVIKRRQVILVQVVKEERGNKGAALTTYLSLAGRYTVLMPNTGRGGGISRKITQPQDRKRLKAIAAELDVPEGMGLIIRTAGAARTKQEIKRDYEYLLRLWESVRDLTLHSTAPSLVYEEGNLIKRSIRDLYTKDVEEIVVAGESAYKEAHEFMRMLMPSHSRNVINYQSPEPLFARFPVERQLNAMFSPYVTLRSGGYLVINQTEALVSIDVNSGKATREFSIEETALNTNLEAAEEIARQLKLRDLAGLIVIDFIDMEEKRNNRAVERRLKDALRHDRARIQVGRISHFGLLEMSRQRLRTGVLEGSTSQCPHCQGTGIIRSTESVALAVLRGIEDHLNRDSRNSIKVLTNAQVALYILNQKRTFINEMESRHGVTITVEASERMQGANFAIERSAAPVAPPRKVERNVVSMDWGFEGEELTDIPEDEEVEVDPTDRTEDLGQDRDDRDEESGGRRSRRRRRRRGRGRDRNGTGPQPYLDDGVPPVDHEQQVESPVSELGSGDDRDAPDEADDEDGPEPAVHSRDDGDGDGSARGRRRRRGRRGGRRGRDGMRERSDEARDDLTANGPRDASSAEIGAVPERAGDFADGSAPATEAARSDELSPAAVEEVRRRDPERFIAREPAAGPSLHGESGVDDSGGRERIDGARTVEEAAPVMAPSTDKPDEHRREGAATATEDETETPTGPVRRGWWQRRFGG